MEVQSYGVDVSELHAISSALFKYHQEDISPDYWHGYFSAIAISPIVLPEQSWMSLVLNGSDGDSNNSSDSNSSGNIDASIKDRLRDLLQGITGVLHNNTFSPYFPGNMDNWKYCDTSRWCEGFLTASHLWPEELQQKAGEELPMLTLPIIIFHDPEQHFLHQTLSEADWEKFMDQSFEFLPQGLYELIRLWTEVMAEEKED